MSFSSSGNAGSRKRRSSQFSSSQHGIRIAPSPAMAEGLPVNQTSNLDVPTGSLRSHRDSVTLLSSTPMSHREPTRSFFHSSYRGQLAPIDSAQTARDVREDTAELASYALSDQASSIHSTSVSRQSNIDSYFQQEASLLGDDEDDVATPVAVGDLRENPIQEVSEPASPEIGFTHRAPGTSVLADMIRKSPQSTSPPDTNEDAAELPSFEQDGSDTTETGLQEDREFGQRHLEATSDGVKLATEETPLLRKTSLQSSHPDYLHVQPDLERQDLKSHSSWPMPSSVVRWPLNRCRAIIDTIRSPKTWDRKTIWTNVVVAPAGYLPSVVLGCLLNILDALSYGMILFPLGNPVFADLGPAGISMFYVSCIVSQLVYSGGGSIFRGGVGSEMIEVVPFFHQMAYTILERVGEDKPEAVIATTIFAYAISSVLTGLTFLSMGLCHFGHIVGFIPRHILIGCIGGVGWFLIATGLEVTARLEGNLNYNFATLQKLFQADTVALWMIPLFLSLVLFISNKRFTSSLYLPGFILAIPAIFYFFEGSLVQLEIPALRQSGWIFDGPDANEPWWFFWTLYKFDKVDYSALAETIPAMFALTFFGILHVPINVPALAFQVKEDHLDLNRELIAHGFSNMLSGFCGSIQNYLVYTNSVLFINSGGNTRVAGIMLAVATFAIMCIGPVIIGFIPVMMVGVLIFVLGYELFLEAVWEPRKKLGWLEYLTVIVIVLVMGTYDFVVGIFVGIILAFVDHIVKASRTSAIRAAFPGEIARSTVRRNPTQSHYLRPAGKQIQVVKLAGYLFFGTIVDVEKQVRLLIDAEAFANRPIRYLILDMLHVTGMDYSSAEAFGRFQRLCSQKSVQLLLCGMTSGGPIDTALRYIDLGEGDMEVRRLSDLNSALESCENELLKSLYSSRDARANRAADTLDTPHRRRAPSNSLGIPSSPRQSHLQLVANRALNETETSSTPKWQNFKEPLRLMLQTFQGLTDQNEDFWYRAKPYFQRHTYAAGTVLYHSGQDASGFYLLEEGILRADYDLPQGRYSESIVAGTTCGELPFFSETDRTATVIAERDCVAWLLDRQAWERLQTQDPDVGRELLKISLKLTSERMAAVTSYVLVTAG